MTKLSVNINKVATIRNARGGNTPNVKQFAIDCERFGAQGITVHPRPDERHIRYADVYDIKPIVTTEFNIEGNPKGVRKAESGKRRADNCPDGFIDLVKAIRPTQVTLVPDAEGVLTSNAGWDTVKNQEYLCDVVKEFKACGIRVSIFIDANPRMIEMAAKTGTDRVELYTESYASEYHKAAIAGKMPALQAIKPFVEAAKVARDCGLGLNAGHDLSLENLAFFHQQIPWVDEVSIGHALISDALYLGIEETIHQYLNCLK